MEQKSGNMHSRNTDLKEQIQICDAVIIKKPTSTLDSNLDMNLLHAAIKITSE